ncbi:IST1 homolog isoform X2 [Anabrus simplex]|uniref:IST1 homolog isoform X2 n=1 Tax=Anabrus simplex TaxID=316456 RepID=UPI0034DD833E
MFASGPNYTKLKTHLRLAINRLKLLEKKKTELAQKARKEIADYVSAGKYERAKIRVEHIIREDYLVEAMEVVEMYCDLLLARFGLIQQMKTLDEGLAEAISSLLWVAPRLQSDVAEMKVIADQLAHKYGRQYADACREEAVTTISEKLKHKLSVQSPPKLLVEKYLIEIAKNYNIEYEPDPQVMKEDPSTMGVDALLLDINNADKNNLGGDNVPPLPPQPAGFIGYPQPPLLPSNDFQPFNYLPPGSNKPPGSAGGFVSPPPIPSQAPNAPNIPYGAPFSYNIPPGMDDDDLPNFDAATKPINTHNFQNDEKPKPSPRGKMSPGSNQPIPGASTFPDLPELPSVPTDSFPIPDDVGAGGGAGNADDIDFDDLTRRFEDLKKRK